MPYDESERVWKIQMIDEDGKLMGFFIPSPDYKQWYGRPQNSHFEILYRIDVDIDIDVDKDDSYLLLYRFDQKGYTDKDYGRIVARTKAASWLQEEGYPIPNYQVKTIGKFPSDLITFLVATSEYSVSRSTLKRAIADDRLISYRLKNVPKNSPHKVSRAKVASFWPKKN